MRLGPVLLGLALVGCSGVSSLRTGPLVEDRGEVAAVRAKVDQAVAERKFADAWNLEAAAGKDRSRLESIAIASLLADDGPSEKMLAELRGTFGGLTPGGRERVSAESKKAVEGARWERAIEIELAAADDPPAFKAAFAIYERVPVGDALAALAQIERARRAHAAKTASPAAR